MTSCGHNFCHACLELIARNQAEWPCPACRVVQTMSPDQLQRNYFLEQVVERNARIRNCGIHNQPIAFCKFWFSTSFFDFFGADIEIKCTFKYDIDFGCI